MPAEGKKHQIDEVNLKYGDKWIWGIYFVLIIVSIIESYSASSQIVGGNIYKPLINQCIFLLAGFALVRFVCVLRYNNPWLLMGLIPLMWLVSVISLVWVFMAGESVNGAARAVPIAGFSFQPAELAKLSVVTMLAFLLARSQGRKNVKTSGLISCVVVVGIFGALMFRDGLTNMLLLMAIGFSMMLTGGVSLKKLVGVLIAFAVVGAIALAFKSHNDERDRVVEQSTMVAQQGADAAAKGKEIDRSDTRKQRIRRWLHSDSLIYAPINDANSQEIYSHFAQAHGGLTGAGLGKSRECSRLPLAFSDYIFSIIVEELGFIGGVLLLLVYMALLGRAAVIATRCRRALPALLIIGMASMITYQALCHMAINVGVMPVSGQPLPLISKGGTSMLVNSLAFGIMLCVSRSVANGYDRSDGDNRNRKNNNKDNNDGDDQASIASAMLDEASNPTQILKNEWK